MTKATMKAKYDSIEGFKKSLSDLKEAGFQKYNAYAPINLREYEDLMPAQSSPVRGCSTFGAIIGLVSFYLMCVLASLIYPLIVGGKPPVSNVPFIIPTYEGTILIGSIAAFIAALLFAWVYIGKHVKDAGFDRSFTGSVMGIVVRCKSSERTRVREILTNAGAVEVIEV